MHRLQSSAGLLFVFCLLMSLRAPAQDTCNEWTTKGPFGGNTWSIAVDPQTPSTIYVGTSKGVYKSLNHGDSWTLCSEGMPLYPNGFIRQVILDAVNPEAVYAVRSSVLFKSTNGGAMWSALSIGGAVNQIAIDPNEPDTLYAATMREGLKKSVDGGDTWSPADDGITPGPGDTIGIWELAIDAIRPATLYACSLLGELYISTDAATTWVNIDENRTCGGVAFLATDPHVQGVLYVGTSEGIYKTQDEGDSWALMTGEIPLDGDWATAISVCPTRADTIIAAFQEGGSGGCLYRSDDGGHTWRSISEGMYFPRIESLQFDPQHPARLYAATREQGAFRSEDGGEAWNAANGGIARVRVLELAIDPFNPDRVYAGTDHQGFYRSFDGGLTWSSRRDKLSLARVEAIAIDPRCPSRLFVGSHGGIYNSEDYGDTWSRLDDGPGAVALVIDPQDSDILYAAWDFIYRSTDAGLTWDAMDNGFPDTFGAEVIGINPIDSNTLVIAGTNYVGYRESEAALFKSTDAGGLWTPLYGPFGDYGQLSGFAMDPLNPLVLYCSACEADASWEGAQFKSADGGETWLSLEPDLHEWDRLAHFLPDPMHSGTVYASSSYSEILESRNGGEDWSAILYGADLPGVLDFALAPSSAERLYLGTFGGVYTMKNVPVPGDCDADKAISVAEVQGAINMLLGTALPACDVDFDGDGAVSIGEVQRVVNAYLGESYGC